MPEFAVFRVSSGAVPPVGQFGSADVYRGDHATEGDAVSAAANLLMAQPGVFLYAVPVGTLTRYGVTRSVAVG